MQQSNGGQASATDPLSPVDIDHLRNRVALMNRGKRPRKSAMFSCHSVSGLSTDLPGTSFHYQPANPGGDRFGLSLIPSSMSGPAVASVTPTALESIPGFSQTVLPAETDTSDIKRKRTGTDAQLPLHHDAPKVLPEAMGITTDLQLQLENNTLRAQLRTEGEENRRLKSIVMAQKQVYARQQDSAQCIKDLEQQCLRQYQDFERLQQHFRKVEQRAGFWCRHLMQIVVQLPENLDQILTPLARAYNTDVSNLRILAQAELQQAPAFTENPHNPPNFP